MASAFKILALLSRLPYQILTTCDTHRWVWQWGPSALMTNLCPAARSPETRGEAQRWLPG